MSWRSLQKGDPVYEPSSDDEDEDREQIELEIADPTEPQPLDINDFVERQDMGFYIMWLDL